MTPKELATYQQNSPGAQKVQGQLMVEKQRGQNKLEEAQKKGEIEQTNKITEIAAEYMAGAIPLERAEGLVERKQDQQILTGGIANLLE
jgi:hypothetical protein